MISTAPDDEKLQKHARLITEAHKEQNLFTVTIIGWSELVRRATRHPAVAAKHFGAYSSGPATPLLAIWRASAGELLLSDREIAIGSRELIHDLSEYPLGRLVFVQQESENLLLKIKKLRGLRNQPLNRRATVLDLRDKLKVQRVNETRAVTGLMMLFTNENLLQTLKSLSETEAASLVRSFVEYEIDPNSSVVTGLEKIRMPPPPGEFRRRVSANLFVRR